MFQRQFRVALIDDEYDDVVNVEAVLQATGLISVDYYGSYDIFLSKHQDVEKACESVDLFVLDVYMQEDNPEPFKRFVEMIKGLKPFIAYTRLNEIDDIELGHGNFEELRPWIIERCGLGLVTKENREFRSVEHEARRDREFQLSEVVISRYWTWRVAWEVGLARS